MGKKSINHKNYYSVIDIATRPLLTGTMMHKLNYDMASRLGGKLAYYVAEDRDTPVAQNFTRFKLRQHPDVDGFIFFQLKQFCYGPTFNFNLLKEFIESGYEVHFTREYLSILDMDDLMKKEDLLYVFFTIYEKDRKERLLQWLTTETLPSVSLQQ